MNYLFLMVLIKISSQISQVKSCMKKLTSMKQILIISANFSFDMNDNSVLITRMITQICWFQIKIRLRYFLILGGEAGSADSARDPRGFAIKFYTDEGNWDLVGNNTPIFFIRDPILFPSFIHTQKRNPKTHLKVILFCIS